MNKLLMNGVEVKLKSPGTEGLKDFLLVQKAMSKIPSIDRAGKTKEQIVQELQDSNINFMDYLGDKELDSLTNLVNLSVNKTFPTKTEEIDAWAMKNSIAIMNDVIEMCSPDIEQTDDQSRAEKLKEKLQADNVKPAEK